MLGFILALCLLGKTECSICRVVLQEYDDVVLHPHILPSGHALWHFSDSAMHRSCYEKWPHHDYFEIVLRRNRELADARPEHLQLSTAEINKLTRDERLQFVEEYEQWSRMNFEELKIFLSKLGRLKNDYPVAVVGETRRYRTEPVLIALRKALCGMKSRNATYRELDG